MARSQRHVLLSWGGPVQTSNRIERGYRRWALSAALLVMFTASVSSTIASAAVPTVVADLGGFDLYGWVLTSYLLASTVGVPVAGKLSDAYGRRPLYLGGIMVFSLGALLAAFAPSMWFLIAARALSGFGGGAMMTLSNASIGDIFSPRERGRWMGITMGVFGVSAIVGPPLGGAITDGLGWRWVFVMPVPLAICAWVISGAVMPRVKTEQHPRPDVGGALLMSGGLLGVLLGFTWAGTAYAWGSPHIVACFAGGAALLTALVWHEARSPNAMLPMALFKTQAFAIGATINFLLTGLMYLVLSLIPLFVQGVLGESPGSSGIVLTPTLLSFAFASIFGGQLISRTGRYKGLMVCGGSVIVAGFALMSQLSPTSTTREVIAGQALVGIGIGLAQPVISMVVQSAFPHSMLGTANSGRQLFSNLGSAVMVPLTTAIVVTDFASGMRRRAPHAVASGLTGDKLTPESLLTPEAQAAARDHFAGKPALYGHYLSSIKRSLADGISEVFLIGVAIAGVAVLLMAIYPHVELSSWEDTDHVAADEAGARATV